MTFIRKWGAPSGLLSDNARVEVGKAVKEVLRKYNIKDLQTEPHHPNQNPAERRIGELKQTTNIIMDRTGAPSCLWYLCTIYVTYLLNRMAHKNLIFRTPLEIATGETPDISALLQFHFYQPVFYYEKINSSFPDSKERLGWWVGVAENHGDALTYKILNTDHKIMIRSVCRPTDNPLHPNIRQDPNQCRKEILISESDCIDKDKLTLPTINPENIVGKKFIHIINDNPHKAKVIEELEDRKYLVQIADGEQEEILTYNEILNKLDTDYNHRDNDAVQMFKDIVDHKKKGKGKYEVLVE